MCVECVGGLEPLCALNALRLDRNLGPSTVYLTLLSVLDTSILV